MSTCTEGCFRNVINLGNSIIGVSILAMPYCFQKCGILLSFVLILSSGLMTKVSCHLLLKAAIMARRRNFEFLAFHTFGSLGKFAVELGIIGFLLGTCIAFFVVIGDLGPPLAADLFLLEATPRLRMELLLLLGFFVALPLGLLRKVDSLTSFNFLSVCFYICLGLKILGESLSNLSSEVLWTQLNWWRPAGLLSTLPIFFMALSCQTQLFEIFDTLNDPSLKRMDTVVSSAVHMCSAVYSLVGVFGYIAFYDQNISGNILVKLSNTVLTKVIKIAFVVSVIVSFPLCLFPCRSSLHSLIYKQGLSLHETSGSQMIPDQRFRFLTLGLVAITISTAILLPDIEFVLGILGSTIGTLICFILPALVFIRNTNKNTNERHLAQVVLCIGLFILVACSYSTLHEPKTPKKGPLVVDPSQPADLYLTAKRPKPLLLKGDEASRLEEQFQQAKVVIPNNIVITSAPDSQKEPEKPAIADDADREAAKPVEKRQEPPVPQEPEEPKEGLIKMAEIKPADIQHKDSPEAKEDPKANEDLPKIVKNDIPNNGQGEIIHSDQRDIALNANIQNIEPENVPKDNEQNDLHPDALKKEDKEIGSKKASKKTPEEGTADKQEAILRQIEQHQQEQKKLLEVQRQLLQELKEHKESHDKVSTHSPPANNIIQVGGNLPQVAGQPYSVDQAAKLEAGKEHENVRPMENRMADVPVVPPSPNSIKEAELLPLKTLQENVNGVNTNTRVQTKSPVVKLQQNPQPPNEVNLPLRPPDKQYSGTNLSRSGMTNSKVPPRANSQQLLENRVLSQRNAGDPLKQVAVDPPAKDFKSVTKSGIEESKS